MGVIVRGGSSMTVVIGIWRKSKRYKCFHARKLFSQININLIVASCKSSVIEAGGCSYYVVYILTMKAKVILQAALLTSISSHADRSDVRYVFFCRYILVLNIRLLCLFSTYFYIPTTSYYTHIIWFYFSTFSRCTELNFLVRYA